jgi:hypothetical protein
MSKTSIDLLVDQRVKLLQEQHEMNQKYNSEIKELNVSIKKLRGYTHADLDDAHHYDDENPDYIKSSKEEI